jgi:hypothetical protein
MPNSLLIIYHVLKGKRVSGEALFLCIVESAHINDQLRLLRAFGKVHGAHLKWDRGQLFWLCCKNSQENTMGVKPHFLFSLGCHSKQAGDEGNLPGDISFVHVLYLSFPNHIHHLIPL